jgi:hypothetical protein
LLCHTELYSEVDYWKLVKDYSVTIKNCENLKLEAKAHHSLAQWNLKAYNFELRAIRIYQKNDHLT